MLKKQLELNETKARQQEEILKNTIAAQENERKRIAQDLHDEVGAMLSVVKLNIGRIEKKTDGTPSKELASETKNYVDEVITQVRRISRSLLPPSLEKLGLYYALDELASWVNKSEQLIITCWRSGEQFRFDGNMELSVFRITQELINNAIKHSGAKTITIKLRFRSSGFLAVSVTDNGKGFDLNEQLKTGLGLKNLESRAGISGARFKLKSSPGKGTMAIICLNTKP